MNNNEQRRYLAPKIEALEISVEQGFTLSNMEQLGEEKNPVEWN